MIYLFLIYFGILGAGIKYIDSAYDEKTFNKKIALCVAPFLGLLWAFTMLVNPVAATILLAVIFGVVLKGKIDNLAHFIGLIVIVAIVFFAGVQLMIVPLIFLALAALLDEFGNDYVDKKRNSLKSIKLYHKLFFGFFDHRWTLKVAILILSIAGAIPLVFFFAMIAFDYAYLGVRFYSVGKQKTKITYEEVPSVIPQAA